MTVSDLTIERLFTSERKSFWLILIALLGAIAVGVVAPKDRLLAIGVPLGILFLLALFKWPDAATILVIFYIYTNVGPVAMNFYRVPSYIAMGFPVLLTIPLIWYLLLRGEKLIITPVFSLLLMLLVIYILGAVFSS